MAHPPSCRPVRIRVCASFSTASRNRNSARRSTTCRVAPAKSRGRANELLFVPGGTPSSRGFPCCRRAILRFPFARFSQVTGDMKPASSTRREEAFVGLFVLIAAGLLIATVFSLTGFFNRGDMKYRAYFKNAGGLRPGGEVRYAGGPPVGRIEDVRTDPHDATRM